MMMMLHRIQGTASHPCKRTFILVSIDIFSNNVFCLFMVFSLVGSVTIAAACTAVYRGNHIWPDAIAMKLPPGYCNRVNYSVDSIGWLDYLAHKDNITICHVLNFFGEKRIGNIFVHGLCDETRTACFIVSFKIYIKNESCKK